MLTTPTPDMISTMKAPPMDAVMFHINLVMQKKKEVKDFIMDYVQYPDASKSVCESNKVQNYGVMPSLKGKVSETGSGDYCRSCDCQLSKYRVCVDD